MCLKQIAKVLFWCTGLICLLVPLSLFAAEPVAATARASEEVLDSTTLRAIFTLRKRRWSDGRPIRVFVLKDDADIHKQFVKEQLHMFPYQLRQQWNRIIFSGTGVAPQDFDDEASLLDALVSTPDAIGYANPENLPEGVSVIEVQP